MGRRPERKTGISIRATTSKRCTRARTNLKPRPKSIPKRKRPTKRFTSANPQDADKKIELGKDFLQKYPMSRYAESVDAGLVQAYYLKQDWKDFYATADQALALSPDDAGVLTVVGWVIPHVYNPNDPDAPKSLDKAEQYEKHAMQVIQAMPKPAAMTDDQFTQSKTALLSEAHSGLGLVYFRRQQLDDSVKELQQATQSAAEARPDRFLCDGGRLAELGSYYRGARMPSTSAPKFPAVCRTGVNRAPRLQKAAATQVKRWQFQHDVRGDRSARGDP